MNSDFQQRRREVPEEAENFDFAPLSFERLRRDHLPMIHAWLHTPHVAKWWHEDLGTLEEVSKKYSAYIMGEEPVEPYLILHDERPIGYIQFYFVFTDEEYARIIGIENCAGIDIFIGAEEFLHRGLGAEIIHRFLSEIVFASERIEVCIIDPEPENKAAIRAYEKAGFRYFKSVETSEGPAYLMKLTRQEFLQA